MIELYPACHRARKKIPMLVPDGDGWRAVDDYFQYEDYRPVRLYNEDSDTLFCGGIYVSNYYHFIFDSICGFMLAGKRVLGKKVVLESYCRHSKPRREWMSLLGIEDVEYRMEAMKLEGEGHVVFPELFAGIVRPEQLDLLREISREVPDAGETPKNVFVQRRFLGDSATQSRNIQNRGELLTRLALAGMKFETVHLEGMSIYEQIRLFRGAENIIAVHGAALTNLAFCRPECRIIEIRHPEFWNAPYVDIGSLLHLRMASFLGTGEFAKKDFNNPVTVSPDAILGILKTL